MLSEEAEAAKQIILPVDPIERRRSLAAEERERRAVAERIAKATRARLGGREAAVQQFLSLKTFLDDLGIASAEHDWRELQRERRRQDRENRRAQRQLQHHQSLSSIPPPSRQGSSRESSSRGSPRLTAAEEVLKLIPSIPKALKGEYDHPLLKGAVKGLCKLLWRAVNHQYNPEAAARDLVRKCLMCLDQAIEWPPTAPPPPPPPAPARVGLLRPALGSHHAELTGLVGSVVDTLRMAPNDR